jgi:ABC-type sugar transport system substrate-binding protein
LKTVALLLDDMQNRYQQLLLRKAKEHAARLDVRLVDVQFAGGASWTQLESINVHLRSATPPDALIVLLAGEQRAGGWLERAASKNISVVFLNRIPSWIDAVRGKFPQALLAGVAPAQVAVGELQAAQVVRLVRPAAFVMLITGAARSPTAIERQHGFLNTVRRQVTVTQLDGRWSALEAEKALSEWFEAGADRGRTLDLIVCHNDAMAAGARRALSKQAKISGRPELADIPFIGCDGIEDEGQAMVRDGKLTATVVLPATTPAAFDILQHYWNTRAQAETVLLAVESFPPLDKLRRPSLGPANPAGSGASREPGSFASDRASSKSTGHTNR